MPKFRITPKKGDAIRIYHKGSIIHYLCLPNDKQERCPITHDLISQHHLTFLPEDATPTPNKPKHVVMQLPCGHRFCALTMYYHMISNDQRCPMCRSGAHEIFEDSMLPEHLKEAMITERNKHRSDSAVTEGENMTEFYEDRSDWDLSSYADHGFLFQCVVDMTTGPEQRIAVKSLMPLQIGEHPSTLVFDENTLQALHEDMRDFNGEHIQFSLLMTDGRHTLATMARTNHLTAAAFMQTQNLSRDYTFVTSNDTVLCTEGGALLWRVSETLEVLE